MMMVVVVIAYEQSKKVNKEKNNLSWEGEWRAS